jgi:predicted transposase/invertase (TIGR01784 family)
LKFLDWIIRLPEDLEKRLCEEISNLEEENKMPYVPSWERKAKEEGIKEGKKEGKKEMARELIKRGIPLNVVAQSSGLPVKEIERLVEAEQ